MVGVEWRIVIQVLDIVDTSSDGSGVLKWGEEVSESSSVVLNWLEDSGSWMFWGVLSDSSTVLDRNPVVGGGSSTPDSRASSGSGWLSMFGCC